MKLKDVAFVVFSHSSCEDIWEAYFGELDKYLPDVFGGKYFFVDECDEKLLAEVPEDFKVVFYNDDEPYSNRMLECLKWVDEKVCILNHEDMILYDHPDVLALEAYLDVLEHDQIDSIKLLKGGDIQDNPYEGSSTLFWAESWFFAVQPSFWRVDKLKEIFSHFAETNIWDLEKKVQGYCKDSGFRVLYSYRGEPQRGKMHWDSSVFPYIATAICKGKWNTAEYPQELQEIFFEYDIDRMKRGFVS